MLLFCLPAAMFIDIDAYDALFARYIDTLMRHYYAAADAPLPYAPCYATLPTVRRAYAATVRFVHSGAAFSRLAA